MDYLDDLAFKLFGPGTSGLTMILTGILLLMLAVLVGVLLHMHLRLRAAVNHFERKPKRRTRFSKAPKTQAGFHQATVARPRSSWGKAKEAGNIEAVPEHHIDLDDPFVQGGHRERRSSYRRSGNPVAVYIVEGDKSTDLAEMGLILDRSAGGLGLEMDHEVEVETILRVRPTNASITTPWVELQVRNCRPTQHRYHVGCQFVKVPSWDVMLAFG